jgi:hypothetical protein
MNDRAIAKEIDNDNDIKVAKYTDKQIQLIHDTYAKNTTKEEFELYMYTASKFGLDPLLKQIWCVKFANQVAQIYAGRDGFLEIAHRSGQFNGIKSGMKDDRTAYAEVYRKDMDNPFYVEVDIAEYSTGQALWKSKPRTMLQKVAESQALRRAFSISGVYGEEEMGQWELQAQGITFNTEQPKAIVSTTTQPQQQSGYDRSKEDPNAKPKTVWNDKTKKYSTPKVSRLYMLATKEYGMSNDDFKSLCIKITGKEHSKDYVNQDCWNIEDEMKKINNNEVEEIIAVKHEPEIEGLESEFADIETASDEDLEGMLKEQFPGITETGKSKADKHIKEVLK